MAATNSAETRVAAANTNMDALRPQRPLRTFLALFSLLYALTFIGRVVEAAASTAPDVRTMSSPPQLQDDFDYLGPPVKSFALPSGRIVNYVDEGMKGWRTAVFIGGAGTSARATRLVDFLRTSRQSLRLRLIVVERNGFGLTNFDPKLNMVDYARDVLAVLNRLRVSKFALIAVSGGGPYAAKLAALAPTRLLSFHGAAALYQFPPDNPLSYLNATEIAAVFAGDINDPRAWWAQVPTAATWNIPGWLDTAYDDGARTAHMRGQKNVDEAIAPMVHEVLVWREKLANLSAVQAPVFLYNAKDDTTVTMAQAQMWKTAFSGAAVRSRVYPTGGHSVHYRHWDQVLLDAAGYGAWTAISFKGQTKTVPEKDVPAWLARGATLGIAAWSK